MAFKGNERRTADDLNREFDEIGAKYNAYTTEEHTVYHAAVLPEYWPRAIELLSELLRPTLREDDFDLERKVILEEIGMYADMPFWQAYEVVMARHFAGHGLGNSVLGTPESIEALSSSQMRAYWEDRYGPENCFVVVSGNCNWDEVVAEIGRRCGSWSKAGPPRQQGKPGPASAGTVIQTDRFVQESILFMLPAPDCHSDQRIAASVLATVVGDETNSRLYWPLIETGKAESVDFGYNEYDGAGAYLGTLSTSPELAAESWEIVVDVLAEVDRCGITPAELRQAKNKLASQVVLSGERPQNRISSLGYNWSYRKEYRSVDDDLRDLEALTLDDIRALLDAFPLREPTLVALGPLDALPGRVPV